MFVAYGFFGARLEEIRGGTALSTGFEYILKYGRYRYIIGGMEIMNWSRINHPLIRTTQPFYSPPPARDSRIYVKSSTLHPPAGI